MPRFWNLADIVPIGRSAWGGVSLIAGLVGFFAVVDNFMMVVGYAGSVSMGADLLSTAGKSDFWSLGIKTTIGVGQVLAAGMLQLGADFGLLFAAGLAKGRSRLTPTAALVLWVICAANMIENKTGLYESLRDQRIAERQAKADLPTPAVLAAQAALAPYQDANGDGRPDRPLPPEAIASTAAQQAAEGKLADLEKEKAEKVAVRDDETKSGRKDKYQAAVDRIAAIDAEAVKAREDRAAALSAIALRGGYDRNVATVDAFTKRTKVTASGLAYDDDIAIRLRVFGMSLLSIISILVAFAANKTAEDQRIGLGGAGEPVTAPGPEPKPVPRGGESASLLHRGLPFLRGAAEGPIAAADAPVRPEPKHPDKAGDRPPPIVQPTKGGE